MSRWFDWFFRWSPVYRAMQSKVQDAENAQIKAELRASTLADQNAWLQSQIERALENERNAMRMQVNFAVQQKFGAIPYPDSPHLSDEYGPSSPQPKKSSFVRGEELVRQRTQSWRDQLEERLSEAKSANGT